MKLLFVDSSRSGWGTEQHFVEMVTALHRAGHDVRAIVRRGSVVDELLRGTTVPCSAPPFRGGTDPRGLWAVAETVRSWRPDWIVTNRGKLYWPMVVMGLAFGVRVALFRHLTFLKRWQERQLLPRLADRFYVVSEFARDVLAQQGIPRERLIPMYNPIDLQRFHPLAPDARHAARERLGLRPDDVVAGFAGRMELGKGVAPLREALGVAMGRMPQLRMVWIGDGTETHATRRQVAASGYGSRHVFTGWQAQVETYLGALDFLIAPSIEPETFGRVVAEAQACGVPVVASGCGGLCEAFLPGRSGLLLDPVNVATLCAAIERLSVDPSYRACLGSTGYEFVRARFAADRIAAAFVEQLCAMPFADARWRAEPDFTARIGVSSYGTEGLATARPPLLTTNAH